MNVPSNSRIGEGDRFGVIGAAAEQRPWRRAALWLAFLGPFFFLTYGFANWRTSRLDHVDSIVFAWERNIPFLEWTILPYMSIDAFYALSLFLCATRAELDAHAKRLLCATLISVTGFLLFPLEFSFERSPTSGFNGALFDLLAGFDKPFNQAPSLHVSLLMLLWVVYARHLRGAGLWLLHLWFCLIGISVFTTYQHHVIDGIAGIAVGVFCLYLFPDAPPGWGGGLVGAEQRRPTLQGFYFVGALACGMSAYLVGAWGWLLLWPATALLLVSLAYAGFGVAIFQKNEGRLSLPARLLLAPYRLCAWLSSRWYTRQGEPSVEVAPGIWIGRAPGNRDWRLLAPRAILDLTAEFNAPPGLPARQVCSVPMLDLATASLEQLGAAVRAMEAMGDKRPLLVHCALGYSRSALAVAAWLLHCGVASTPKEAVERVHAARPQIVLSPDHIAVLDAYFHARSF